jgi:hypothetical protein
MYTYAPSLKHITRSGSSHATVPLRTRTRIFLALGHLNPPTSSFTYSIYVVFYPLNLCAGGFSLKVAHNVPTCSGPRDAPVGLKRAVPNFRDVGVLRAQVLPKRGLLRGGDTLISISTEYYQKRK